MFWGILLIAVLACGNAFYISNPIVRARVIAKMSLASDVHKFLSRQSYYINNRLYERGSSTFTEQSRENRQDLNGGGGDVQIDIRNIKLNLLRTKMYEACNDAVYVLHHDFGINTSEFGDSDRPGLQTGTQFIQRQFKSEGYVQFRGRCATSLLHLGNTIANLKSHQKKHLNAFRWSRHLLPPLLTAINESSPMFEALPCVRDPVDVLEMDSYWFGCI